jgi:putative drug exporter of the RND superfamily
VPIAVFAFLFGLSMDYEIFILTRLRESCDQAGVRYQGHCHRDRLHRLVTVAALSLFLAFVSLASTPRSTSRSSDPAPAPSSTPLVIRSLLVPAFVSLLGSWNWYLPGWLGTALRVTPLPGAVPATLTPKTHHITRPDDSDRAGGSGVLVIVML